MINELKQLANDTECIAVACLIVRPDGNVFQYTRIIDNDHAAVMSESMFKFYIEDMHHALWNVLKEEQSSDSEGGTTDE